MKTIEIGPPSKEEKAEMPTPKQMAARAMIRAIEAKDYPRLAAVMADFVDLHTKRRKSDED